ncbi:MAG: hypothetical protein JNJ45_03140 [Chthonomonas sp.]|nr:hypothetical protein [Chthonomonas sp.]
MSFIVVVGVILAFLLLFLITLPSLIHICAPNEVLIFSGSRRQEHGRDLGYRVIKGGRGIRVPFMERVDRMDLTNMVIDVTATNAYSKGGIPVSVQGVANVKIASQEPLLNNAIERFLNRSREEIIGIAKATLEGSLRGIVSTMTPEQINEDKLLFAERLVHEVEADMTALGLAVDTMKIQHVQDEVHYLDSIGRRRNAEVISSARIAEAKARAESSEREASNKEQQARARVDGQIASAKADAERRLLDATSRREAVIAEELAVVAAEVAKAKAEVAVQTARVEQVRRRLEAEVIEPAKAQASAAAARAKAQYAPVVADGTARAEALTKMAEAWKEAGPGAREIVIAQKVETILAAIGESVNAASQIKKVTVIDQGGSGGPGNLLALSEQLKEVFGLDVVEKVKQLGSPTPVNVKVTVPKSIEPSPSE